MIYQDVDIENVMNSYVGGSLPQSFQRVGYRKSGKYKNGYNFEKFWQVRNFIIMEGRALISFMKMIIPHI